MSLRANHYDAAFEAYLREAGMPYVAVNEARRSRLAEVSLKSLDFVVAAPNKGPWLIDVKGRRGPHPELPHARKWENWVTQDDLVSMRHWETVFGGTARAMLVFAYWLSPEADQPDLPVMFQFRNRSYGFYGVWANDYRHAMQVRSPKWDTVWLPSRRFRELRFPLDHLTQAAAVT